MKDINAIAVFCGSKAGASPAYEASARELGGAMAEKGIRLVFGGGRIGIMGFVADEVLSGGGEVTGVIPHFLHDLEVGHDGVTELIAVESMHERKNAMFMRSDAFVILPGGLGTLDECLEIITWKQLQLHAKPIVILDVDGYWKTLRTLIEGVIDGGFAHPKARDLFVIVSSVDEIFTAIANAPEPDREVLEDHL
ncbi:MAG: TIGR00730 family Rossman fold protein [Rhodospirillales bacterium]|jgi:hypothetical protein|nr:TIGR00730 family Rossman fold protein [Rhodospirillaceae bacterium]MDP6109902.1 TIGR00730 family Rossman fold protein [Rhodospirillales bacterium]